MTAIALSAEQQSQQARVYRRRTLSWAMYDWANSAVVTIVIAAVFPIYFNTIAQAEIGLNAGSTFSFLIAISLLTSAVVGPIIGTLGDLTGGLKRLLIINTIFGALAVIGMYSLRAPSCASSIFKSATPFCVIPLYSPGMWVWAAMLFFIMQVFINNCFGLYNSLLSHITPHHDRDRVSSLGYGIGYFGGGLLLAVGLGMILAPKTFGLPDTETATRLTLMLSGIWWIVFSIPLILFVPEPPATKMPDSTRTSSAVQPLLNTFKQMGQTFREIRGYRHLFIMLVAFWLYSDGIGTIIQLATTYGTQELKLGQSVLIGALLLTQFVAFPYSILYGRLGESGAKDRDMYVALMLWTVITLPLMGFFMASANGGRGTGDGVTLLIVLINQVVGIAFSQFIGRQWVGPVAQRLNTKTAIILGLGVYVVASLWGFFMHTAAEFWMLGWLIGTVQGGTQALSRSLYSNLSPRSKAGEFFGFYGFSDKFAGILGPILFGVIGLLTGGSLRISILSVVIFFVVGAWLLLRVDEVEGAKHAHEEDVAVNYHDDVPDEEPAIA